ncbi:unnamed protein product, partial [Prorocentrum cordatum]
VLSAACLHPRLAANLVQVAEAAAAHALFSTLGKDSRVRATFIADDGSGSSTAGAGGEKAWNGEWTTFYDARDADDGWTAADLGRNVAVSEIQFLARPGYAHRMTGGRFEATNDITSDVWDVLHTITTQPADSPTINSVVLRAGPSFRYIRYCSPSGGHCNIACVDVFGQVEPTLAWAALVNVVWASQQCYWSRPRWRGVNFGGWLLLEPGPSWRLWAEAGSPEGVEDEYGLCLHLRATGRLGIIEEHRRTWMTEETFRRLALRGLNAVRIPFGYWIVTGPTCGEPFVGPGLEHLDRAVDLAERFGFQVVLDLHGNPGGESGAVPTGRRNPRWTEADWRREEALQVLAAVAGRFAGRRCVAGIQVANEPSPKNSMRALCDWFEKAIGQGKKRYRYRCCYT